MSSPIASLAALALAPILAGLAAPPGAAAADPLRASQLVGKEARDASGTRLGRIEDLLLDPGAADLRYVILSEGSRSTVHTAKGVAVSGEHVVVEGAAAEQPAPQGLLRGSRVLASEVRHPQAGDVGDVEDFFIAPDDGRITHLVVAFDPAWYESQGWVAVPVTSFRREGADFVAAFEPDDLRPAARARAEAEARAQAQAKARAAAEARMKGRDARLGELVKAAVRDASGNPVGVVTDLVVDMHERRIAFALVAPGPGAPPVACRIAPGGLAIAEKGLALPPEAKSVDGVPSCTSAGWPRGEGGETPRYVMASELLRTSMLDPAGRKVGTIREVVVQAETAALHYLVADFEPRWMRDGMVAGLALRPARRSAEGLTMRAELADLHRSPVFEEKRIADVWSPAFAKGMDKYLYGR